MDLLRLFVLDSPADFLARRGLAEAEAEAEEDLARLLELPLLLAILAAFSSAAFCRASWKADRWRRPGFCTTRDIRWVDCRRRSDSVKTLRGKKKKEPNKLFQKEGNLESR